jgi:hypothetical protein
MSEFDTQSTVESIVDTEQTSGIVGKPLNQPLTKEQKLERIDSQIDALVKRRQAIVDGVEVPKGKPVVIPEVGAEVHFKYGRTTATTAPTVRSGKVVATRAATTVDGKTNPALVKIACGEGFDLEVITIFPAQIVDAPTAQ